MRVRYFKTLLGIVLIIGISVGIYFGIKSYMDSIVPTVIFQTNGGETVESISVDEGSIIYLPIAEREGHKFVGWYYDRQLTNKVNSSTIIMTNKTVTLYAGWEILKFTVTIRPIGASEVIHRNVEYGTSFDLSVRLTATNVPLGYYGVWQDAVGDAIEDETAVITVTSNLVFTQRVLPKEYTIKYYYIDSDGHEQIIENSQEVAFNETVDISQVESSRGAGYSFLGWKFDIDDDEYIADTFLIDVNTEGVEGYEISVLGIYDINEFTVWFCKENGDHVYAVTQEYLSQISESDLFTASTDSLLLKEHEDLVGWLWNGVAVDFDTWTVPAEPVNLRPKYEFKYYTLSYYCDYNGEDVVLQSGDFRYNSTITNTVPSNTTIQTMVSDAYRFLAIRYEGLDYSVADFETAYSNIEGNMDIEILLEKYKFVVNYWTTTSATEPYYISTITKGENFSLPTAPPATTANTPQLPVQDGVWFFGGWLVGATDVAFTPDYDLEDISNDVNVFADWYIESSTWWTGIEIGGEIYLTEYKGDYEKVVAPSQVYFKTNINDPNEVAVLRDVYGIGTSTNSAISGVSGITVLIGNNIHCIRKNAFNNIDNLVVKFTVSDSDDYISDPLTIEDGAFGSIETVGTQYSITSITLPARTVSVAHGAFRSARDLIQINVASDCLNYYSIDGVLYSRIGGVHKLLAYPHQKEGTTLVIDSIISTIEDYAFYYEYNNSQNKLYSELATVTLEANSVLTNIGVSAFSGNGALRTVDLSNSDDVVSIGNKAFYGCFNSSGNSGLTHTFVMNALRLVSIGDNAFAESTLLTNIEFNNLTNLQSLGSYAFYRTGAGNTSFDTVDTTATINLKGSITTIKEATFRESKILISFDSVLDINIVEANAFRSAYFTNLNFAEISSMGEYVFANSIGTSLVIEKIVTVGQYAFANAEIETVRLDYVATLLNGGISPFYSGEYYSKIKELTFGNNCTFTNWNNPIFSGSHINSRPWLERLELCDSITTIGQRAMNNLTNLQYIKLPTLLAEIGDNAFENCSRLAQIEFRNTVRIDINYSAFKNCSSLTSVMIKNLSLVGNLCFENCTSLEQVVLIFDNDGMNNTIIGKEIFKGTVSGVFEYAIIGGDAPAYYEGTDTISTLMSGAGSGAVLYINASDLSAYENMEYNGNLCWSGQTSAMLGATFTADAKVIYNNKLLRYIGNDDDVTIDSSSITSIDRYAFAGNGRNFTITIIGTSFVALVDSENLFSGNSVEAIRVNNTIRADYLNDPEWSVFVDILYGMV